MRQWLKITTNQLALALAPDNRSSAASLSGTATNRNPVLAYLTPGLGVQSTAWIWDSASSVACAVIWDEVRLSGFGLFLRRLT
jgi:hypothetical protein